MTSELSDLYATTSCSSFVTESEVFHLSPDDEVAHTKVQGGSRAEVKAQNGSPAWGRDLTSSLCLTRSENSHERETSQVRQKPINIVLLGNIAGTI